jgi:predicted nucleic acid-binding protein
MIEFTNILATYVRSSRVAFPFAQERLAVAAEVFADNLVTVPPERALVMANDHLVTGYDAHFLAVAQSLGTVLITEDARLRQAAPELTQSLGEAVSRL